LQKNPYHIRAWWLTSKCFVKTGQYQLALQALRKTQRLTKRDRHDQYHKLLDNIGPLLASTQSLANSNSATDSNVSQLSEFQKQLLALDLRSFQGEDDESSEDESLKVEMM
jgi:hypothetical protein